MDSYNHQKIEEEWRKKWQRNKTFEVDLQNAENPYYNLMMFPYPSAEGLHVGNMYAFTGSDIWGRFMSMKGHDVFEPIGLDGFGIHSENYAIKVGRHPQKQAEISEKNFYRQLRMIGSRFSWAQKLETYDLDYYQWTQWIFIQLFKAGLAYRKKAPVNWCPQCKTVLADEQVIQGKCERCDSEVKQKDLEQWFFKITDYADRLLDNLKKIDWSQKVKTAQRKWIGRKEGVNIKYSVVNSNSTITCFTTRPDTNFGAAFIVLAPEHRQLDKIVSKDHKKAVSSYVSQSLRKTKQERMAEGREKSGVFTGSHALNKFNKKKMPIYVSDFVLGEVGTGAVVGVPGHDKRDFQFAKKFDLPVIRVVAGPDGDRSKIVKEEDVWEGEGELINSGELNGLKWPVDKQKIFKFFKEKGFKKVFDYHLRDWLISRQRYWGPPIPMIHCPKCGWNPVPEEDLPVELPEVENWRPKGEGRGPLDQLEDWKKVSCPQCGGRAEREVDVSDTFLDSAWYFLRYPNITNAAVSTPGLRNSAWETPPKEEPRRLNPQKPPRLGNLAGVNKSSGGKETLKNLPWNSEITKKWLPVDMYIGGAEHSVLHLLYSRFLTMFFYDQGLLEFEEPFTKFRAHGLIIKDGAKMSKSKGNIINPDQYIEKYGADALRCYLMFLGPLKQGGDFRDTGIQGMRRFLDRVYRLCSILKTSGENISTPGLRNSAQSAEEKLSGGKGEEQKTNLKNDRYWEHKTIKKVTDSISRLKYNTAISALMEYVNYLTGNRKLFSEVDGYHSWIVGHSYLETLILLLAPFAPYLAEDLWQFFSQRDGNFNSVHNQAWPQYKEEYLQRDQVKIPVQVNGKLRAVIKVDAEDKQDQGVVSRLAQRNAKVKKYLKGKKIKKTIFVKSKLINFVV